jgi:hypothetical protein
MCCAGVSSACCSGYRFSSFVAGKRSGLFATWINSDDMVCKDALIKVLLQELTK